MTEPGLLDLGPRIETGEHYALLRHVLPLASGVALEFGVGKGESTRIIAEHMPVIGFDSWQGLPEDWRDEFPKGSFTHPKPDIANAQFVDGWFADTLPTFNFPLEVGLVHIDCDLYSSTAIALKHTAPHLKSGAVLVFDEFHSYRDCELHEQRAFCEYMNLPYRVLGHGHEAWAVQCV